MNARRDSQDSVLSRKEKMLEKLNNGHPLSLLFYQLFCKDISLMQFSRGLGILYFRNRTLQIFMVLVSCLACVIYVQETYKDPLSFEISGSSVQLFEWLFFFIFLVDFVLSVMVASSALKYLTSFNGIVDILTLVPIVAVFSEGGNDQLGFLRIFRAVKVLRIVRIHRIVDLKYEVGQNGVNFDSVALRAAKLCISLFGIVFISAGLVLTLQELTEEKAFYNNSLKSGTVQFHDAIYFIITTLSTVGYGDIHPQTSLSRATMMIIIVISLIVIPPQVTALAETIQDRPKFQDSYQMHRNTHHIVLVGTFTSSKLIELVRELFADDHGHQSVIKLRVVVLDPKDPDKEFVMLLAQPRFKYSVKYIKGSPLDPRFLRKAKVESARYIFILLNSNDPKKNEECVLTAMAIRKYLGHQNMYNQSESPNLTDSLRAEYTGAQRFFRQFSRQDSESRRSKTKGSRQDSESRGSRMKGDGLRGVFQAGQTALRDQSSAFLTSESLDGPRQATPESKFTPVNLAKHDRASTHSGPSHFFGNLGSVGELFGKSMESFMPSSLSGGEVEGQPKVVAQIHSEREARILRGCGVNTVINVDEMRMALLAMGTLCPGFIAVVLALVRSTDMAIPSQSHNDEHPNFGWQKDYFSGINYEIYCIDVPEGETWKGLRFKQVALAIYEQTRILMVAVMVEGWVVLFPDSKFCFGPEKRMEKVFLIARSLQEATAAVNSFKRRTSKKSFSSIELPVDASPCTLKSSPRSSFRDSKKVESKQEELTNLHSKISARSTVSLWASRKHLDSLTLPGSIDESDTPSPMRSLARRSSFVLSNSLHLQRQSSAEVSFDTSGESAESSTFYEDKLHQDDDLEKQDKAERAELLPALQNVCGFWPTKKRTPLNKVKQQDRHGRPPPLNLKALSAKTRKRRLSARSSRRGSRCPLVTGEESRENLFADIQRVHSQLHQISTESSSDAEVVEGLRNTLAVLRTALENFQLPCHEIPSDLHGHVLLTGEMESAEHFILAIRRVSDFPIVLVNEDRARFLALIERLRAASHGDSGYYNFVYYVQGSSKNENDLKRCKIESASAVVILGNSTEVLDNALGNPEDMETLLTTMEVEQVLQSKFYITLVIAELSSEQSTFFMGQGITPEYEDGFCEVEESTPNWHQQVTPRPSMELGSAGQENSADETTFFDQEDLVAWPLFAAGRVFHQSTLNLLAVRLYHSPEELDLWQAVLHIGDYKKTHRQDLDEDNGPRNCSAIVRGFRSGVFDQISLMPCFAGKTYSELFKFLFNCNALAIGLYRPLGCKGSKLPYIHLNPSPGTRLLSEDKAFVILSPDYSD